jgi:predicted transposase YbfD/YdcC
MLAPSNKEFINCFKELDDTREPGKIIYPLHEVLFLVMVSVLSCAESWRQIHQFGIKRINFFKKYFPFEHGIPSKSTICSIIGSLNQQTLTDWFNNWAKKISELVPDNIISIDGKTIRGSRTNANTAIHILHAYVKKQGIIIGTKVVEKKTNKISHIPKLLDEINVKDSTVTIDALGCQKHIAAKIIKKEANYFLGLKSNHPHLLEDTKYLFSRKHLYGESNFFDYYSEKTQQKGRLEHRKCWTTKIPNWFREQHSCWENLTSLILVESERHIKNKRTIEQRYYISSHHCGAKKALQFSREHWGIENQVHYVLDVTFSEDHCQIKNAAENMSVVRKTVINLIRKYKSRTGSKESVPTLRKCAAWCDRTASEILKELHA